MKKNLIFAIAGLLAGCVLAMIIIWNAAPGMMMIENESAYGFEESLEKYTKSVAEKGWKIPAVHNFQETMKKYGKDVDKVTVFELCHPEHAYKILAKDGERIVSSMMPCRVAFYKKSDGKVYISRMNTSLMGKMMGGIIPEVMGIASKESEEMIAPVLK